MKYLLLLLIPFVFSCKEEKKEEVRLLSYTEKLFQKEDISINLPQINNGEYFFEQDSVLYVNVFILNDSTIRFNDSVYNLPIGRSDISFMMRNVGVDSTKDYTPKVVAERVDSFIKQNIGGNKTITFNLFCDSSISYKTISAFYHHIFMLSLNNVSAVNLFGNNNRFVSVNYSRYVHNDGVVCFFGRNTLEILINSNEELSIENDWLVSFTDIKPSVINFYNASLKNSTNPYLREFKEKTIREEIQYLRKLIEDGDSNKLDKLYKWERLQSNVYLVGEYNAISDNTAIIIELNKANKFTTYLSIIDSITSGINELRNSFCLARFGKNYNELDNNLYIEYKIKEVIKDIYSNKINSLSYLPIEIPPPPPKRK